VKYNRRGEKDGKEIDHALRETGYIFDGPLFEIPLFRGKEEEFTGLKSIFRCPVWFARYW
jgi:hypothetical protein